MKWKRGDLVEAYDSFTDSDSVYCLPWPIDDNSTEIPAGAPVLILDPHSDEGFEKYGGHPDEQWVLVLWEGKEWFVYTTDLRIIKRVREQ